MAHRLGLGETRQADRLLALEIAEPRRELRRLVKIDAGHLRAADLEDQRLLDAQRAIPGEGRRRDRHRIGRLGRAALLVHASTCSSALTKAARSPSVLTSVDATTIRSRRS